MTNPYAIASAALGDAAATMVTVSSCEKQHDSTKRSCPQFSVPKAGRDQRAKVWLSKKHPQDLLGRASPGPEYTPNRMRELPKYSFGTAPQRPPQTKPRYPETTNDLLHSSPDGRDAKHPFFGAPSMAQHKAVTDPSGKGATIGASSRHNKINAPDLCEFPLGGISPGPQRYHPERGPPIRMAHAPKVDNLPPAYSMGLKTEILGSKCQTPARVGPGIYPVQEACGEQPKSENPSLPKWKLYKNERFPHKKQWSDHGRLWDGEGEKKIRFQRSFSAAPSFSFGAAQRAATHRVARVMTSLDGGPAATMPRTREPHPVLPPRSVTGSIDML